MAKMKGGDKTARGGRAAVQAQMLEGLHKVWLAGMGAVSKAQHGAPKMFDELVAEGARFQADTRDSAEAALRGALGSVQQRINAGVTGARGQANEALANLEKIFQTRVHRALAQLGVPSAAEVHALGKRIDALNANIDRLARRPAAAAKGRGKRATRK
ncbi:MAG: phasin family protein [Proteobacteria bacterium]|nr:phasin family protein [Pseudomonadota bacterium]